MNVELRTCNAGNRPHLVAVTLLLSLLLLTCTQVTGCKSTEQRWVNNGPDSELLLSERLTGLAGVHRDRIHIKVESLERTILRVAPVAEEVRVVITDTTVKWWVWLLIPAGVVTLGLLVLLAVTSGGFESDDTTTETTEDSAP